MSRMLYELVPLITGTSSWECKPTRRSVGTPRGVQVTHFNSKDPDGCEVFRVCIQRHGSGTVVIGVIPRGSSLNSSESITANAIMSGDSTENWNENVAMSMILACLIQVHVPSDNPWLSRFPREKRLKHIQTASAKALEAVSKSKSHYRQPSYPKIVTDCYDVLRNRFGELKDDDIQSALGVVKTQFKRLLDLGVDEETIVTAWREISIKVVLDS